MLVFLPSPILELQHAPLPPKCCEPGSVPQFCPFVVFTLDSHLSFEGAWEHVTLTPPNYLSISSPLSLSNLSELNLSFSFSFTIYLRAWHVLKAWRLHLMEKIKNNGVWCAILDDLHTIVYMLIELGENIEAFMICGRNKIIESFTQHLLGDSWIQYFWT